MKNQVGLKGVRYRGGGPMLAWVLHRIGGVAMVVLVGMHALASFSMQQFGSDLGTAINTVYESPYFQVFVVFFVLFHAINGLRIIVLDVWPKLLEYQREITWLQWLIFVPIYGLTVFILIQRTLSGE
ncbi:MAG: hypothetical protein PHD58_04095 [Anaerolineales bacterium]|nr:hypothetical protein [Anaerolineales bacterium]